MQDHLRMELPFNFITFSLFLAFILAFVTRWKRSRAAKKLPPSPWKLPFIGNLHHLMGSPTLDALRKLAQKYGDLIHLQLGEIPFIVVSSPRLAKEILKTHDLVFASRPEFLVAKIMTYNCTDILCCPYGDYWRQMRKLCTLELLTTKSVRSFGYIRQDEALQLIASIQSSAGAGEPINFTKKVSSYTSSMVCRAAFGKVSKDDRNAFIQIMKEILPLTDTFDVSDIFPSHKILHHLFSIKSKLVKVHNKLDRLIDNIIDQYVGSLARTKLAIRDQPGHEDLVEVLLRVKESGVLPIPITKNNIKAVAIDMFIGGTQTSTAVIEWVMSEMIRNPNVMAKAQAEIRKAFLGKKTFEESNIQELRYLKLVIQETLRLHPPVPLLIPRECREECKINEYIVSIGTRVIVNVFAIGRDPNYWDDPESFKPERFENNSVNFMGSHFEYLPFGAGRRMCPGMSFGLSNVYLSLVLLLYHFDWKLPDGLNSNDLDMTESLGLTASRKSNLHLLATIYDPSLDI